MKRLFAAGLAWVLAAACVSAQESAPRNAVVPLEGATLVHVRARAGSLKIQGAPEAAEVSVRGTARASHSDLLSRIQLVAERRGDSVYVEAVMPEQRGFISFGGRWSALDLEITVPTGTAVNARDGSGSVEIRGTGALRVVDGSGSLIIEDVMGPVDVNDGSGELVIRNVTGPLNVRDGSGSIRIEDVGHEVVLRDGSGEITIRRVGNVRIESDGSGDISITDASGSVHIESPGSGRVSVANIGGDFTVASGRARRVSHANVRGQVNLPSR